MDWSRSSRRRAPLLGEAGAGDHPIRRGGGSRIAPSLRPALHRLLQPAVPCLSSVRGLSALLVLATAGLLLATPQPAEAQERGVDRGALVDRQGNALPWADRMRWAGEELYFNMEFRGSLAARSALSIGDVQDHEEHGQVIPIQGIAASTGIFATVYPMENDGLTLLDPETGFPVQAVKEIRERQRRRVYDVRYERDRWRGHVNRILGERESNYRRWLPSDVHDGFSWIYDLRTRDLSVGNAWVYYVYDGWRLSRLTIRVLTHEELFVSALGPLDVAYFEVYREVLDSHSPLPWAGDLVSLPPVYHDGIEPYSLAHGWISLDERRIPVGVEVSTGLGLFRLIIARHVPPTRMREGAAR